MIDTAPDARGVHGPDAMLDALRRAAGADAVEVPVSGWTVHGNAPRAIVSPTTVDAVAAVLELCSAEGWIVEPAGSGTWLDHGRAPERPADIILSTRRLDQRLESEPADLVVGTDAGVKFDVLQARLATHGQELTLDPPHHPDATIAATIALAAAGPLRASAGTPRDHVLGIEAVSGDGRLLRFGGRVVKNVAGYDAVRLLTGSRGTLGVITSVWLRVRARPVAERSFALSGELPAVLQVLAGLQDMAIAATELLSPSTAAALGLPRAWTLTLRLRGGPAELTAAAIRIAGSVAGAEFRDLATPAWDGLARLELPARPLIRVTGLGSDLQALLDRSVSFISASGNDLDDWHLAAHARSGIVRLWPKREPEAEHLERLVGPLAALREETHAAGGTVVLECAPPALQEHVPARATGDEITRRLETSLKQVFDPAGILAPGRWP
ncbi:MAG: FAD-binding oxidoreductase [Candidatus Cloacimonetes bacterium]|nr:FAD-binding oxidoreductase [Candidatus Cloacimonadota bacterium]